jgi:hypothetical protein
VGNQEQVNVVLLVTDRVKVISGPRMISQILAHVKIQEEESKVLNDVLETQKQEITEINDGTNTLGPKF